MRYKLIWSIDANRWGEIFWGLLCFWWKTFFDKFMWEWIRGVETSAEFVKRLISQPCLLCVEEEGMYNVLAKEGGISCGWHPWENFFEIIKKYVFLNDCFDPRYNKTNLLKFHLKKWSCFWDRSGTVMSKPEE